MTTKPRCFIGIDPGVSGAIAMIPEIEVERFYDNVKCEADVVDWQDPYLASEVLEYWGQTHKIEVVALEKVWGRPGQNVKSTSMLMENFGAWKGILSALDIPFIEVLPSDWQTMLWEKDGKDTKKRSLKLARDSFPGLSVMLKLEKHHNRADALNIGRFVKEQYESRRS